MASMSIPWQVFPAALLILAIGVLVWNSKNMRLRLGDKTTREDIHRAYPRAKTFTFRRGKPEESS